MTIHFHDHGGTNFNILSNDKHQVDINTVDVDAIAMQSVPQTTKSKNNTGSFNFIQTARNNKSSKRLYSMS